MTEEVENHGLSKGLNIFFTFDFYKIIFFNPCKLYLFYF